MKALTEVLLLVVLVWGVLFALPYVAAALTVIASLSLAVFRVVRRAFAGNKDRW